MSVLVLGQDQRGTLVGKIVVAKSMRPERLIRLTCIKRSHHGIRELDDGHFKQRNKRQHELMRKSCDKRAVEGGHVKSQRWIQGGLKDIVPRPWFIRVRVGRVAPDDGFHVVDCLGQRLHEQSCHRRRTLEPLGQSSGATHVTHQRDEFDRHRPVAVGINEKGFFACGR